jgi:hypothetical protein
MPFRWCCGETAMSAMWKYQPPSPITRPMPTVLSSGSVAGQKHQLPAIAAVASASVLVDKPDSRRNLARSCYDRWRGAAASLLSLYDSSERLLAAAAKDGAEACIRRIRAVEASDPTSNRYPRTKLSDDASLIVWDFDGLGVPR